MNDRGTLYLFCGKMAAGKSTLAGQLADRHGAVTLSEDRLLAELYPNEVHDVASYVRCSTRLKNALEGHIAELLRRGISVVLDFPANTVGQRAWMRGLINKTGAPHELHVLRVSDALCRSQLTKRVAEQPERRDTDTEEMFERISAHFQAPTPDEGFQMIEHRRS